MNDVVLLIAGFLLLVIGGEVLVRGAVKLAASAGLSALFIGIAVVGFGTSVPELVTCVQAALAGSPGLAIGSIVGSNISNILLIIGSSALLLPLVVSIDGVKRDGMAVLGVAVLFASASALVPLNRPVGLLYIALLFAYLIYTYLFERRRAQTAGPIFVDGAADYPDAKDGEFIHETVTSDSGKTTTSWPIALLMTIAGIATIILGGRLLVEGAVGLARELGVSETVIGLTIVAIGTSMPELATSVIAAMRRATDVAVGNILGSNIYNTVGVGGTVGLVAPANVPSQIIGYDNLIVIAATVALLALVFFGNGTIRRSGGAVMVAAYALYVWSLWPNLA